MDPPAQQIQDLREQFLKKLDEEGSSIPGGIHPSDLARIKTSDEWLRRFLLHHDLDQKEALTMMWDTCKWRKSFGTSDISEKNVCIDYLEDGSMFSHGRDRDGKSLFILKCKKHVKGQRDLEALKRCIVYWFERLERQDKGDKITIFFDMAETGLSNMDMDFTKYLISLFKLYYPDFLNYILIFEMPWVLNAAFKIIKSWLPEQAVQKIQFVNKNTLKQIVEPDNALTCWGGRDDYVFSFVPEDRNGNGKLERKVHFAEHLAEASGAAGDIKFADGNQSSLLKINPAEYISFHTEASEMSALLTLTNISHEQIVLYKIKITSPEKYRVKPSSGTLKPGSSVSISVVLHAGFQTSGPLKDKFLIMCMPVESADMTSQELADSFKNNEAVELHRLRCQIGTGTDRAARNGGLLGSCADSPDQQISQLTSLVSRLTESSIRVEGELRRVRQLQSVIMALIVVLCAALAFWHVQHILYDASTNEQSCIAHSHSQS